MDFFNDDFGFGDSPNPRANKNAKYLSLYLEKINLSKQPFQMMELTIC